MMVLRQDTNFGAKLLDSKHNVHNRSYKKKLHLQIITIAIFIVKQIQMLIYVF